MNTLPHVEEYHDVELSPFHPFPAFACSFKLYGKMYIIGGIAEDKGGLPNGEYGNWEVINDEKPVSITRSGIAELYQTNQIAKNLTISTRKHTMLRN